MSEESARIERNALVAVHAASDAALRASLGLDLLAIGDGTASLAAALPATAIVLNRVVGLGTGQAIDAATLSRVRECYAAAGIGRYFVQLDPRSMSLGLEDQLHQSGLQRTRSWQKFVRGRFEPLPETRTDLATREIGIAQGHDFARIVCPAFDLGESAIDWLARLPGADGWRVFVSYENTHPVGVGALYIEGRVAWTDFGATAPASRGRGVQRANLVARVRAALAAGCVRIHTCTGVQVAGEPQHSYGNIRRCGFRESCQRENWAPATS